MFGVRAFFFRMELLLFLLLLPFQPLIFSEESMFGGASIVCVVYFIHFTFILCSHTYMLAYVATGKEKKRSWQSVWYFGLRRDLNAEMRTISWSRRLFWGQLNSIRKWCSSASAFHSLAHALSPSLFRSRSLSRLHSFPHFYVQYFIRWCLMNWTA